MNRTPWLWTLTLLLFVGCGGPQRAEPGELGSPCETPEDCRSELACKAASCQKARSDKGGICVTDRGCDEDLSCVSGRCSSGRATAQSCMKSCAHLRSLMQGQHEAGHAKGQGEGNSRDSLALLAMMDFEQQCQESCVQGASQERASCLFRVEHLDEIKLCP